MKNMFKTVIIALVMVTANVGYTGLSQNVTKDAQYDKKKHTNKIGKKSKSKKLQITQQIETGIASWYGKSFIGKKTASGEKLTSHKFTAAHKKLPLGSIVKVTNTETQEEVLVTINDRGPYKHGRILDLAPAAAKKIGLMNTGLMKVKMEVISIPL